MKRVMVRYKLKPERVEENEALVRAVYAELQRTRPAGFRYGTFKLDDGVSFVHVATVEDSDGRSPLADVAAFKEFTAQIGERCEEPPVTSQLHEIGSFEF